MKKLDVDKEFKKELSKDTTRYSKTSQAKLREFFERGIKVISRKLSDKEQERIVGLEPDQQEDLGDLL